MKFLSEKGKCSIPRYKKKKKLILFKRLKLCGNQIF